MRFALIVLIILSSGTNIPAFKEDSVKEDDASRSLLLKGLGSNSSLDRGALSEKI